MTVTIEILAPQDQAVVNNTFTISLRARCECGADVESVGYPIRSCHSAGPIVRTQGSGGWMNFSVPIAWPGPLPQGHKRFHDFIVFAYCKNGHSGRAHRVFQTEAI